MISPRAIIPIDDQGDLNYSYADGRFFLYDRTEGFLSNGPLSCRDEFRGDWEGLDIFEDEPDGSPDYSDHRLIGFTRGRDYPIDIETVHRRWMRLERMANVSPQSTFYRTTVPGTIIIRLSPFWVKHTMRRSLVTLLLRMVVCYWRTGLDQAINDYPLASEVKPAIKWFLAGNTKATFDRWNDEYRTWNERYNEGEAEYDDEPDSLIDYGDGLVGFVGEFSNASAADLKRKLIKP